MLYTAFFASFASLLMIILLRKICV
jgi:hypothetical protein